MIERLLETTQPAGGPACIDQRVRNRLVEKGFAHVMRAGKSCEYSVAREELECPHVQLAIAAQRVVQSAFRFRERRGIENNQIVFGFGFLRRAHELKYVLFNPVDAQFVARSVSLRARDTFRARFHSGYLRCARPRASERECALIRKTIQDASPVRMACDGFVMRQLIQVEARLLRVQEVDNEAQASDLDFRFARRFSHQDSAL